jgi:hypothetical protein
MREADMTNTSRLRVCMISVHATTLPALTSEDIAKRRKAEYRRRFTRCITVVSALLLEEWSLEKRERASRPHPRLSSC